MEVIIVGGGPSGSACALALVKYGYSVTIIDKDYFPREKLCAGVLPQKTIKLINELVPDISDNDYVINTINTFRVYSKLEEICCMKFKKSMVLTDRLLFDNLLIRKFVERGGKFI